METDNIKIYCPKCGSELDLSNGQLLGSCSFCDSLIPLPFFVTNPNALDNETIKNMLNRLEKINEYSSNYQFHRAFNLYDKLIKNNYNVNIEDFYPYWGKVLSQYGVVYSMNDLLKSELITLNIRDESIFDNEFYKQATEICDANTFQILKKEASLIDNFQKEIKKELLTVEPLDICILVDTRSTNPNYQEDLEVALKLQEKLSNYHVEITDELFRKKNKEIDLETGNSIINYLGDTNLDKEFILKYTRYLIHSKVLIVVSNSDESLNDNLYRHLWMSYFNQDEIKESIKDRMFIVSKEDLEIENLPIKELKFYKENNLDELSKEVVISMAKLSNNLSSIYDIDESYQELLKSGKFEEIKNTLNEKLDTSDLLYHEWWLMFLSRHQIKELKELENRVIDPLESFYYHKTYLTAPRHIKSELFEYQKHTREMIDKLSVVDEKYENEVKIHQIRYSKQEIMKIISSMIPCLLSTLLCYWTFSISNALQLIFTFIVLCGGYYLLIKKIFHVFSLGKVPETITTEAEKIQYYHHLRQALTPEQAFLFLPNKFIKKIKAVGLGVLIVCMTFTLSYFVKESVVKIMHPSVNYYYVFSDVVITGGAGENIIIPKEIAGRTVTKIDDNAFNNNQSIKTVIISNGVKQIGKDAFRDCKKLKEVTVPASIQRLNGAPFEGCNAMEIFIYQGTTFAPDNFLGPNYQEEMFELNIQE